MNMSRSLRFTIAFFVSFSLAIIPAYSQSLPPLYQPGPLPDKDQIITPSEVQSGLTITANQINDYFRRVGSQLADYVIPVEQTVWYPVGQRQWESIQVRQEWQPDNGPLEVYHGKTAAQLIAEWALTDNSTRSPASPGKINPLTILATIDKESAAIVGADKANFLSNEVRISWFTGYGYNDRMANCANSGTGCDVEYNRQRAIWYGGIGQQIVELTAALKRWSANPTLLSPCGSSWQNMTVQGECRNLKDGFTYALYRYTPTYSGQQIFRARYLYMRDTFGAAIATPPPATESSSDTAYYELRTYAPTVSLTGSKSKLVRASFNGGTIGDMNTDTWNLSFTPEVGDRTYTISYLRSDGSTVNTKQVRIIRHAIGDINNDGKIDLLDVSLLSTYWLQTDPQNPMTNFNPDVDNEVNILDLSLLASQFKG